MSDAFGDLELRETAGGTFLKLKVSPGARRNAMGGVHAGLLRVTVTAAPEKGKANRGVLELLAKALDLPARSIELVSGETAAHKSVFIHGLGADELRRRLAAHGLAGPT